MTQVPLCANWIAFNSAEGLVIVSQIPWPRPLLFVHGALYKSSSKKRFFVHKNKDLYILMSFPNLLLEEDFRPSRTTVLPQVTGNLIA